MPERSSEGGLMDNPMYNKGESRTRPTRKGDLPDVRPRGDYSREINHLQVLESRLAAFEKQLSHPYAGPAIRQKADAIMAEIQKLRAKIPAEELAGRKAAGPKKVKIRKSREELDAQIFKTTIAINSALGSRKRQLIEQLGKLKRERDGLEK
ncbi:MAG: hypothetical protein V1494_01005 [Candidatus Diapherotrites archaeon]